MPRRAFYSRCVQELRPERSIPHQGALATLHTTPRRLTPRCYSEMTMKSSQRIGKAFLQRAVPGLAVLVVALSTTVCSHAMATIDGTGATTVLSDEFNCRSPWSDARQRCAELEFIVSGEPSLDRAYKVPSLRNVAERAPYMDAGQFGTFADVLDHYNRAPAAVMGHTELRPLRLKPIELRQLEAFLRTLSGPIAISEPAAARRTP